jgi:hypothetical protein
VCVCVRERETERERESARMNGRDDHCEWSSGVHSPKVEIDPGFFASRRGRGSGGTDSAGLCLSIGSWRPVRSKKRCIRGNCQRRAFKVVSSRVSSRYSLSASHNLFTLTSLHPPSLLPFLTGSHLIIFHNEFSPFFCF